MRGFFPLVVMLVGCAPGLRGDVFVKDQLRYRVQLPDASRWHKVGFAENDLAWSSNDKGHLLAMNSTCKDHGDPSLEVLTTHLLFGFDDRDVKLQKAFTLDGREALRTVCEAAIDGVLVDLEIVVLKKNGCVHDFTYVSPRGKAGTYQADFDALVAGFAQESAP